MATDLEKLKVMAEDTIKHKKLVLDNCLLMANYLLDSNKITLATELLKRGCEHDNSKFDTVEFRKLSQILKGRECFTNAATQLTPEEAKAIKEHWKKNRHHPEYFDTFSEMSELDMLEMVCDWFARSLQYGTDFIPFIEERQLNRFHFEQKQFDKILKYCRILEDCYNKQLKEDYQTESETV